MQLSPPAPRTHIHTRRIECHGYERDDGLWDVEGTLTDSKSYSFDNADRGIIAAGEHVHRMKIRLTVDSELLVHAAEAVTEASPYAICPDANGTVSELAGEQIGPGWRQAVKRVMGRTKGCTHVRDMIIGPVAHAAYQTIIPMKMRREQEAGQNPPEERKDRPAILDTCHAYDSSGPVVQRTWPQFFKVEAE